MPTRHAFIAEVVPRADLSNAVAMHSVAFNVARFLGPLLAGGLVSVSNEGLVFVCNGLTYVFFLLMMSRIPRSQSAIPDAGTTYGKHIIDGLRYAWTHPNIRNGLMIVAMAGLVAMPHDVLMPVITHTVFHAGPGTLGLLLGAAGAGSLLGALVLAHRGGAAGLAKLIGIAGTTAGIAVTVFGASTSLWLSLPVLLVAGFCLTTLVAGCNILIQLFVPDRFRGRVLSLFMITFIGTSPIGNLIVGALAELIPATSVIMGYGVLFASCSLLYLYLTPESPVAVSGQQ